MSNHRQVSKEEFEILTRFHPGEIRYYVDTGRQVTRNKGAKVSVTRKPQKKVSKKVAARGGYRGASNRPVQLTTKKTEYREGTLAVKIQRLVKMHLESDPTKVIGRSQLVTGVANSSVYSKDQVNPIVSELLKQGDLRYTGEASVVQ